MPHTVPSMDKSSCFVASGLTESWCSRILISFLRCVTALFLLRELVAYEPGLTSLAGVSGRYNSSDQTFCDRPFDGQGDGPWGEWAEARDHGKSRDHVSLWRFSHQGWHQRQYGSRNFIRSVGHIRYSLLLYYISRGQTTTWMYFTSLMYWSSACMHCMYRRTNYDENQSKWTISRYCHVRR